MATSRRNQISQMPEGDSMCRVVVGNHVPAPGYPVVDRTRDGGYEQMFVCANCDTKVYRYRDRHGFLIPKRSYSYRPGYLLEEGGRMTLSEKALVFVQFAGAGNEHSKVTELPKRGRRRSA